MASVLAMVYCSVVVLVGSLVVSGGAAGMDLWLHELCLLDAYLIEYSYGDIRLFLNGSSFLNNSEGVIEVFINDEWGTVCIHEFNLASAAAACRQLGFINAIMFNTPMELK